MMVTSKPQLSSDPGAIREGEFWRINGIAEKTSQSLHQAGVETFAQLGELTVEEIEGILPGQVGIKARATRQDWFGQARSLAQQLTPPESRQHDAPADPLPRSETAERQHYESFKMVLLFNEDRSVRRTQIENILSSKKDGWAGWDPERLIDWIVTETQGKMERSLRVERTEAARPETPANPRPALAGDVSIRSAALLRRDSGMAGRFFFQDQALEAALVIGLNLTQAAPETHLAYRASITTHPVGPGSGEKVAEAQGEISDSQQFELRLPLARLSEGTQRLITRISVSEPGEISCLQTDCDLGLVHIYLREAQPVGS